MGIEAGLDDPSLRTDHAETVEKSKSPPLTIQELKLFCKTLGTICEPLSLDYTYLAGGRHPGMAKAKTDLSAGKYERIFIKALARELDHGCNIVFMGGKPKAPHMDALPDTIKALKGMRSLFVKSMNDECGGVSGGFSSAATEELGQAFDRAVKQFEKSRSAVKGA